LGNCRVAEEANMDIIQMAVRTAICRRKKGHGIRFVPDGAIGKDADVVVRQNALGDGGIARNLGGDPRRFAVADVFLSLPLRVFLLRNRRSRDERNHNSHKNCFTHVPSRIEAGFSLS